MNYYRGLSAAILGVGVALIQIQSVQALTKADISKTAQSITVRIQDAQNPQSSGSGVIIKREGQIYTVLTAHHVVQASTDFTVMTPDDKQHPMNQGSIQIFPGVDLALIRFTSAESYSVAKMGDSAQSPSGTGSFVAGFPGTTAVRSEPSFYFTSGEIAANANKPLTDGYAIAYNNPTLPGMSGGPVLNEKAELIGIHGRAENAAVPQNAKIREDVYVLKTEFNYAVPISTFLRLAPQVDKTLAFQGKSTPVSSAPKGDDFFLQADEKLRKFDYKGALEGFNQALRINPNYEAAYAGRGVARTQLEDKKGAIDDLSQAIRLNPNNVRAYAVRGSNRFYLGDKPGAEADLKKVLSLNIDSKDYRAYNNRGILRSQLGDKKGAIADYDQAIRIDPSFTIAYSGRGAVRSELGDKQGAIADYNQAIADYNQAIRINPNYADAYYNRGIVRSELGDKQGEITDYDQAIRINPNYASAYNNRGFVRSELGDNQGAITDYDQAIRINPNYASAYNNRGIVRYKLGDKQGSIADYDQAIRINSNYAKAYGNRGIVRSKLGDNQGAIADYNQAIRINPNYADAYNNRGIVRYKLGDKQGSIADWKKAASLYKAQGNQKAYQNLIQYLQKLGVR
jgi:tetratricopeptide (TPR) repeat protein